MKEFRCKFCHRLLAKVGEAKKIEIKCPKCKTMNLWDDDAILIVELGDNAVTRKMLNNGKVRYDVVHN